MNITHIIGNGFDINQGIPTSYAHFYEYYLQLVPEANEPEIVSQFRINMYNDLLENKSELWSDMELALGAVTKNYNSASDYEAVYMDVYRHLMVYIDYAYKHSSVSQFANPSQTLYLDLTKPWLHLVKSDIEAVEKTFKRITDNHVKILSFNYTDTFNRLSDIGMKSNAILGMDAHTTYRFDGCTQIHHAISSKDIILGVDNPSQIANSELANEEIVRNLLVKPQTNQGLGTLVDRDSRDAIAKSDIISIYGVSLGATDKSWWEEIGKRIKTNLDVIILFFPFVKEIDQVAEIQKPTLRSNYKKKLMDAIGIDKSNYKNYEKRIYVNFCNNPGLRNIFANPKRASLNDNFENVMAQFQKEGKIYKPKPEVHSPLSIDTYLLHPKTLFEPRVYQERNLLLDMTKNPLSEGYLANKHLKVEN